jgi:hypothetical protein
VHHRQGESIVDHHDCIFSRKGHRAVLVGDIVNFHASGEGPQGHEILHHAAIPELVVDGVGVVQASLLEEPLEVVHGQSRLLLAAARDSCDAHHTGATCLLVDAIVITGHGGGLLAVLLAPLLASLSDAVDDGVGHRFPAATWDRLKLDCCVVDDALGGDAA